MRLTIANLGPVTETTDSQAGPRALGDLVVELRERTARVRQGGSESARAKHTGGASCWCETGSTGCSTRAARSWS